MYLSVYLSIHPSIYLCGFCALTSGQATRTQTRNPGLFEPSIQNGQDLHLIWGLFFVPPKLTPHHLYPIARARLMVVKGSKGRFNQHWDINLGVSWDKLAQKVTRQQPRITRIRQWITCRVPVRSCQQHENKSTYRSFLWLEMHVLLILIFLVAKAIPHTHTDPMVTQIYKNWGSIKLRHWWNSCE